MRNKTLAESTSMAEYLAHRQKIAELRTQETQLAGLIESKRSEIGEANSRIPDISHLTEQRQDLLADLALGKTSTEEVAALDREIASRTAEYDQIVAEAKRIKDVAEHAISGLNRRLDGIQKEIAALSDVELNQRIVRAVLQDHAESLGEEYIKAANQTAALFMRLMALSGLLQAQGQRNGIAAHCSGAFEIPSFNLDACRPYEIKAWPGNLFLAQILPGAKFQQTTEAEREILSAAGLESF